MFDKPFDLRRRRSGEEALGFYLVQLLLLFILSVIIGHLFGSATGNGVFGIRIQAPITAAWSLILSILILQSHKSTHSVGYGLLVIVAGVLGLFGGSIFGLIVPAFLSTRR